MYNCTKAPEAKTVDTKQNLTHPVWLLHASALVALNPQIVFSFSWMWEKQNLLSVLGLWLVLTTSYLPKIIFASHRWKVPHMPLIKLIYPVLSNGILELQKGGFRTRQGIQCTQKQNKRRTKGHMHGRCSWCHKEPKKKGGTEIYKRVPGIMREAQPGITLSLLIINEEEAQMPNKIIKVWAPYMARCSEHWHVQ